MTAVRRNVSPDESIDNEDFEQHRPLLSNAPNDSFKSRYVLALMGFIGFINVYAMRVNLSVAIIAMVNNTAIPRHNFSNDDTCIVPTNTSNINEGEDIISSKGTFVWNEFLQGIILGSFFWGYIITNPIGGLLADFFGGKRVYGIGVFITSILTLATPTASEISPYCLIVVRVLIGLGQGVTFPAMNSMLAKWFPPLERGRAAARVFTGGQVGVIICYPLSGFLCNLDMFGGWPLVFYVTGVVGLIWCIAWMNIIYDTPSVHPTISTEEKEYIISSLKTNSIRKMRVPWRSIITSVPFWAIAAAHVAQNWGFYFLLTEMPSFLNRMLHFNMKQNGMISALPYLLSTIFAVICGSVGDAMRAKGCKTVTVRRIFNTIGFFCPMICLVAAGYSGCEWRITVSLLILAVGLNGAVFSGYMVSHIDIAPRFAGTLMGVTNCFATVPGFVAPVLVGALVNGHETIGQWQIVFWISGVVYFVGNALYVLFISGDEQSWANPGAKGTYFTV